MPLDPVDHPADGIGPLGSQDLRRDEIERA
jgi:hypothetical protein